MTTSPRVVDVQAVTDSVRPDAWRFHKAMAVTCAPLCVASGWGMAITPGPPILLQISAGLAICAMFAATTLCVLALDRTANVGRRDAALALPWIGALLFLSATAVGLSQRLGVPLRDAFFLYADRTLGFNLPAIMRFASTHSLGFINRTYGWVVPLMVVAILAPALGGFSVAAQRFALANAIAELVSIPMFMLAPAIGPWVGYGFRANAGQIAVQASIFLLRAGSPPRTGGIICFPSFHVIWAVLSAAALWDIKWLRIPCLFLTTLIVASTLTTGWHYAVDVLAGLLIAAAAQTIATRFVRR